MITSLLVKDFQSLADVYLDLKPLTVIVGPSSSGKSALIRAVQLLTSNRAGTSYVRRGATQALVGVDTAVSWGRGGDYRVTVCRGKESFYDIEDWTERRDEPKTSRFTKLGLGVPDQVSKALGIPPGDQPNFAGQFDRPYLLDETGSAVAKTLGELTNIVFVMEAARAANQKRGQISQQLKDRKSTLESAESQLASYHDLPGILTDLDVADALIAQAIQKDGLRARLKDALFKYDAAKSTVVQLPPAPPDIDDLIAKLNELVRLQNLVSDYWRGASEASDLDHEVAQTSAQILECDKAYRTALEEAGQCPTCGQTIGDHVHAGT